MHPSIRYKLAPSYQPPLDHPKAPMDADG